MLSNRAYDFCKWLAIVGLHAIGVAYAGLAAHWGWPYASEIQGTLDIVGTLLGIFLAWETYDYNKSLRQISFSEQTEFEPELEPQDEFEGEATEK